MDCLNSSLQFVSIMGWYDDKYGCYYEVLLGVLMSTVHMGV
jgi:hypothetical protein